MPNGTRHIVLEAPLKSPLSNLAVMRGSSPGRVVGELLVEFLANAPTPPGREIIADGVATRVYIDDVTWARVEQYARDSNMSVSVLASKVVAAAIEEEKA